jgi:predicted RND superfamily exporter protein
MARDLDDNYDDQPEDRPSDIIRLAKEKAKIPAIGLIITGVISLLFVPVGIYQYMTLDDQFEKEIQKFEKQNPNASPQQKEDFNAFMGKFKDGMKIVLPGVYAISFFVALLTIYGGLQLMKLKGRGLVYTASILSLLPCTSSCCVLGLIFGIWAIVVLSDDYVKRGYRLVATAWETQQDDTLDNDPR